MNRAGAAVLLFAIASTAACKEKSNPPPPGRERDNTVSARPEDRRTPGEVCDRMFTAERASPFRWPELAGEAPGDPGGRWRWVNVWATWCKPCVEEMPLLLRWRDRLSSRGGRVELVLVSADESDEPVKQFRLRNAGTPASLRLADPDSLATWLEEVGVGAASLPVHLLVDGAGKLRCARTSGLSERDYEGFETLVLGR